MTALKTTENQDKILMVFDIGAAVTIGNGIQAMVTAIVVRSNHHVLYEVNWWDGSVHTCKFLDACEISGAKESLAIGFHSLENCS